MKEEEEGQRREKDKEENKEKSEWDKSVSTLYSTTHFDTPPFCGNVNVYTG